ncbi:uncharacterized protein LOC119190016 [Manduca sexta]|uniref:Uncharacterized protein n=1 Tax=Manduca sexta TaxID=7130 RepID=A0A921ZWB0_MANSE|nr:uncharacterized protein LOC119190016 [Manduca sexta]KAG6464087.1 hypothetical protein O3G_MSEX014268 [Manduca sexta]
MILILLILVYQYSLRIAAIDIGQVERGDFICKAYGYHLVEAKFGKETYLLCLKRTAIGSFPLTSQNSALLLEPDSEDHKSIESYLEDLALAYGFPIDDPAAGSAEGYIGEDHQFYGVLHLGNRTLHADPYGKDDLTKIFGAFENDNMAVPRLRRDDTQVIR